VGSSPDIPLANPESDVAVLAPGEYLGDLRVRVQAGDFVISRYRDRVTEEIPRHTHASAHLVLVLEGWYRTSARGGGANCPATTLIFNPAGTTHRDRFLTRGGSFLTMTFDPMGRSLDGPALAYRDCHEAWLAVRLYREALDPDVSVLDALATELLAALVGEAGPSSIQPPSWLDTARSLLDDGYAEPMRIANVAAVAGVHPFHLARTFRRFLRCTPGEYLRRRRLRRAAILLRSSDIPLAAVAAATGFSDQSQLTRTFRRYTGFPPGAYRRAFGDVGFAQDERATST